MNAIRRVGFKIWATTHKTRKFVNAKHSMLRRWICKIIIRINQKLA